MSNLDKLIEQYERETGKKAYIKIDMVTYQLNWDFGQWMAELASRPTCGVEQRKFLDEIDKEYKTDYSERGLYKPSKNGPWNTCFIWQDDEESDLQKVLKGE